MFQRFINEFYKFLMLSLSFDIDTLANKYWNDNLVVDTEESQDYMPNPSMSKSNNDNGDYPIPQLRSGSVYVSIFCLLILESHEPEIIIKIRVRIPVRNN